MNASLTAAEVYPEWRRDDQADGLTPFLFRSFVLSPVNALTQFAGPKKSFLSVGEVYEPIVNRVPHSNHVAVRRQDSHKLDVDHFGQVKFDLIYYAGLVELDQFPQELALLNSHLADGGTIVARICFKKEELATLGGKPHLQSRLEKLVQTHVEYTGLSIERYFSDDTFRPPESLAYFLIDRPRDLLSEFFSKISDVGRAFVGKTFSLLDPIIERKRKHEPFSLVDAIREALFPAPLVLRKDGIPGQALEGISFIAVRSSSQER